ncbi:MAG: hypothetical protein ACRELY_10245, partial [Polyangiaceae bacterium]
MALRARSSIFFGTVITSAAIAAACGSDDTSLFSPGADGGEGGGFTDSSFVPSEGGGFVGGDSSVPVGPIVIAPADKVLDVTAGGTIPTISYTATVGGVSVTPAWSIDRGEIGSIDV